MAARKSERLLNLAICLLMARRFLSKQEIREAIEHYREASNEAAFEKMFERDKDTLRDMGIPVQTGSNDAFLHADELGYRILRKDFELPPIEFDAAELAVLGIASQVWDQATQAEQAKSALAKLRAAGADPDPGRLAALTPSVGVKEEAFAPMWQAVLQHIPVSFDYHSRTRQLQPWAITHRRGVWYVFGFDLGAAEPRIYRLTRIESPVRFTGQPGAFTPEPVDQAELLARIEPYPPDAQAVLAIRQDAAAVLRRRGTPVDAEVALPAGFRAYQVDYSTLGDFVGEVCSHGPDVIVLGPPALREQVIEQLRKVAFGGSAPASGPQGVARGGES
jgi:proteasome accessory factor B